MNFAQADAVTAYIRFVDDGPGQEGTTPRVGDYQHIDAGTVADAFVRLQSGARSAVETRESRVLVDLRAVDPVDGAMLAVLARMAQSLGPAARVALVMSPDTLQYLSEWRLDSMWQLHTDPDTAVAGLLR